MSHPHFTRSLRVTPRRLSIVTMVVVALVLSACAGDTGATAPGAAGFLGGVDPVTVAVLAAGVLVLLAVTVLVLVRRRGAGAASQWSVRADDAGLRAADFTLAPGTAARRTGDAGDVDDIGGTSDAADDRTRLLPGGLDDTDRIARR